MTYTAKLEIVFLNVTNIHDGECENNTCVLTENFTTEVVKMPDTMTVGYKWKDGDELDLYNFLWLEGIYNKNSSSDNSICANETDKFDKHTRIKIIKAVKVVQSTYVEKERVVVSLGDPVPSSEPFHSLSLSPSPIVPCISATIPIESSREETSKPRGVMFKWFFGCTK